MKTSVLMELAEKSYMGNDLNEKTVLDIARRLNRHSLKIYVRALKELERRKNVIIALPDVNVYNKSEKIFGKMFEKYKLSYQEDPTLLIGPKIRHNDLIYDFSLKSTLKALEEEMVENYE